MLGGLPFRVLELEADQPTVYLLMKGRKIVYIGQSQKPWRRFAIHEYRGEADRVIFFHIPLEHLDRVEGELIYRLRPPLNKKIVLPPNFNPASGVSPNTLRDMEEAVELALLASPPPSPVAPQPTKGGAA